MIENIVRTFHFSYTNIAVHNFIFFYIPLVNKNLALFSFNRTEQKHFEIINILKSNILFEKYYKM